MVFSNSIFEWYFIIYFFVRFDLFNTFKVFSPFLWDSDIYLNTTPLHIAVEKKNNEIVKRLLNIEKIEVNCQLVFFDFCNGILIIIIFNKISNTIFFMEFEYIYY